jgi:hypothetical protein
MHQVLKTVNEGKAFKTGTPKLNSSTASTFAACTAVQLGLSSHNVAAD